MSKKLIAVILSISIICSLFIIPVSAAPVYKGTDDTSSFERKAYPVLDKIINVLVGGIAAMIVTPDWENKKDYETPDSFLPGNTADEFKAAASDEAAWYMGYDNASLLTGKEVGEDCDGDYYVGGSLSVTKKLATEQYDDQKVRTVAISDGRGITIFSSLDAYGMANTDIRAIREQFLSQYKGDLEITAINISALHQHSCVDTFGMNGDIVSALFTSSFKNLLGLELPSGQNKEYMNNLYSKTVETMNNAIADMKKGDLFYGSVDVGEFIRDKRDPQLFDPNLNRFRFVPEDGSRETWFVEGAIHCVGNGAGGTELTGDYPYYMEQYINTNYDANFFYIEGAELAISSTDNTPVYDGSTGKCTYIGDIWTEINKHNNFVIDPETGNVPRYPEGDEREGQIIWGDKWDEGWNPDTCEMRAYGEILAQRLATIDEEESLAPKFSIALKETWIEIDNNILVLAAKGGLLVNNIHKAGLFKYEIITELGYAEFGDKIAVAIIPGELAPEIAFGDADNAENSWYGEEWDVPAFNTLVGDKKLIVFGITNDQVGYMLTDNNWHSILCENEEIVSTGRMAGRTVAESFIELLDSLK